MTGGGRRKISKKVQLPSLRFGIEGVQKIWKKRMTDLMNESVNDKGDYRTAHRLFIWQNRHFSGEMAQFCFQS